MGTTQSEASVIRSFRTADLSQQELMSLCEKIEELYLWFSPSSGSADILKRLTQHPDAYLDLVLDPNTNMCDGFSVHFTQDFQGERVMFRGGTVVRHKSKGDYKRLLAHSIGKVSPSFMAAMTQNPRVYQALRYFSQNDDIYPSPAKEPTELVRAIAKRFCKAPGIDEETLIVRDVYENIRKESSFKTIQDDSVAKMFAELLKENDGFFVVVAL